MARPQASHTVQVDEPHVRVTEWRFAPGEATGYHKHAHDYVVVPTVPGVLTIVGADGGETRNELKLGQSYARPAGVEHDVVNATDAQIVFVEIEMKR
ncbi:cupin domain-containing protein [Acuticoccus sp. M5D2P5]|uniref:cupin domain-containing protein n=1 Tax=Acuticoccus kalidii TaxID=2910977 RepID=UPI001F322BED|nr:cupin domain-containing protein [Acuticoccus kalidii]MCF3936574.1 cupin domain-containing protein [Acuticoccus kalidii]